MQRNRLSKFFWWIYSKGGSGSNSDSEDNSSSESELEEVEESPFDKIKKKFLKSESQKVINVEVQKVLKGEFSERVSLNNGEVEAFVEWYPSIPVLIEVLDKRKHNESFKGENASHEEDRYDFTQTNTYGEAVNLCLNGWPLIVPKLESLIEKNVYQYNISKKSTLHNTVAGYCPNVPNSLMNLPNSMFLRELDRIESRTLHIVYCNTVSGSESTDNMVKAGAMLLAAIKILELQKISIRLDLCFDSAKEQTGHQCICNLLKIKDYGEQLDLLKLSFPLAHPSMARRIGFAAAETIPGPTLIFHGYGRPMSIEEHRDILHLHKDIIVLNVESLKNKSIESLTKQLKEWDG